jgi:hypothetical protein
VDKLNSRCGSSESESSSCAMAGGGRGEATEASAAPGAEQLGQRHHHRHSMDASSSINAEHLFGTTAMEGASPAEVKRAMSAAKLAELALIDPKKAKRYVFFCGSLLFVPYEVHLNVFFVKVKWIFEFGAFLAEIVKHSGSSCYMMIL